MTLNITVATSKCIYQCADYQMTDMTTRMPADGGIQKIFIVNSFGWSASVCYSGVAKYSDVVDVEQWLADAIGDLNPKESFDRLIENLLKADEWLKKVPAPNNRHSFSVGAFIGIKPVFALVSNFETLTGLAAANAAPSLSVHRSEPTKARVYVSGERGDVTRPMRRRLEGLARGEPDHEDMYAALVEVNSEVASKCASVSKSCFTSHVRLTGEGGGCAHEIQHKPHVAAVGIPAFAEQSIQRLVEDHFGPGGGVVRSMSMARSATSEEEHKARISEKPDDPNLHSNYGAYLHDKKNDSEGAEREYRKAIAIDSEHVNALGNLANLVAEQGDDEQAAELYRKALNASPGAENVSWNYANFLVRVHNDIAGAIQILDLAIPVNSQSGRLRLFRGQLKLQSRDWPGALEDYRAARECGADQRQVESGIAYALHLNGSPADECIAAYRTALALAPEDGSLMLNLSQLLFIASQHKEASKLLSQSLRSGIDESAQLEAHFYGLAHTSADIATTIRDVKALLRSGVRLQWDVRPNIAFVRTLDGKKAAWLELVADVMAGERDASLLDD